MKNHARRLLSIAVMTGALAAPMLVAAGPAHALLPNRSCGTIAGTDSATAANLNKVLTGKLRGAMNAYRLSCARAIADASRDRGLADRAAVIAITTAIVESVLENNPNRLDLDSVGLFQQRDSWGSFENRLNPTWSTNAFLNEMVHLYPNNSWQSQPIGVVSQKVQRSAYPDRYQPEAADAQRILNALSAPPPAPTPASRVHVEIVGADGGMHNTDADYAAGQWTGAWTAMGGSALKGLTSAVTGNTMHVFALGSTGRVYTKDANYTTGQWSSGWQEVPGDFEGATAISASGVGNQVHLEVLGAGGVMHNTDADYGTGQWTGVWTDMGGTGLKALTSAVTGSTMHVYAVGAEGQVFTRDANYATGQWTGWQSVPGGFLGATAISASGVGSQVHLEVLGAGGVMHNTDADYGTGQWTGVWTDMGGTGLKALTSAVTDKTMHVYAVGAGGQVFTRDANYATGQWTGWQSVPGDESGATAITASTTK